MMFAFRADIEMLLQYGSGMDRAAARTLGGNGTRAFTPDHFILPRGGCYFVDVREPKGRIQVSQVRGFCFHEYSVTVITKLLGPRAKWGPVLSILPGQIYFILLQIDVNRQTVAFGGLERESRRLLRCRSHK